MAGRDPLATYNAKRDFAKTAEPRGEVFRTSADYAGYCRKGSEALAPAYTGRSA